MTSHPFFRVILAALAMGTVAGSLSAQPLLPWRQQINERLKQQDKLIAELLQRSQPAPAPISPAPHSPIYLLPIAGDPKQLLPIDGPPKQPLPIDGAPKQELPPKGPPKTPLPIDGPPKMPLPSAGGWTPYTRRSLGPRLP